VSQVTRQDSLIVLRVSKHNDGLITETVTTQRNKSTQITQTVHKHYQDANVCISYRNRTITFFYQMMH